MAKFSVPSQVKLSVMNIGSFLGVDFSNYPTNVDEHRSPGAVNMVRDVPGKVRKSMGYERMGGEDDAQYLERYDGRINGVWFLYGSEVPLVHAGTAFYYGRALVYDGAADARSVGWQFGGRLYILDGKAFLCFDGEVMQPVGAVAYVPTVTIALSPRGGDGTHYEDFNLLQPRYRELFMGTTEDTAFQLSFVPLDDAPVEAQLLSGEGEWLDAVEGVDFTVNRESGVVSFNTAPGPPPITGEDNVRITAARTVDGYAERINGCDVGATFGVAGAADRLFVSGNPDYPNYDWYSGQGDPSYFPDLGYTLVGSASSRVMGYSIVDNYLAAHKDDLESDRNVILREGNLVDSRPAFPVVDTMQGMGAVAKHSFCYLANEPLYLTALGIHAITPLDVNGRKYPQGRSFYLDGRLKDEPNLAEAAAIVFQDMYILAVNGKAYILDGLQPVAPERGMPYSTRQYAAFYRENLPARVMWVKGDRLYFGTDDGRVFRMYADKDDPHSYNDDGAPIVARWETPDLDGSLFYKNKSFRYVAVRLASSVATGLKIYGFRRGFWTLLKEDNRKARFLDFSRIDFSKFSFSGDFTAKLITSKVRIKKVDKARFAFENGNLDEPFGLFDLAFEFRENGNAK